MEIEGTPREKLAVLFGADDVSTCESNSELASFLTMKFDVMRQLGLLELYRELYAAFRRDDFAEHFGGAFSKSEDLSPSLTDIPSYTVFVWCDEVYIAADHIGERGHGSGTVYHANGKYCSGNFNVGFEGEPHYVLGALTQAAFEELKSSYINAKAH